MKFQVRRTALSTLSLCLSFFLVACASSFEPASIDVEDGPGEVRTQTEQGVTVSTTILSDDQARQQFGVDLAEAGLQAVWLRIENSSDHSLWLLVSALDANYYPPDEAAAMLHSGLNADEKIAATNHFQQLAIPLKTPAGTINEGFVLTPRYEGGRYVVVKLAGTHQILDFGFAVTLPDGDFDFERLDPDLIYAGQERPDLALEQLRTELVGLPCCVTNKSGEENGDPLNLVIIGNIDEVLAAMSRSGWSFTHRVDVKTIRRMLGAAVAGDAYPVAPVSSLYFRGRPQDLALQRARNTIIQRNHLRLWLAPFRFEGRSVWVGQISRDIAVKATTKSPTLTTHVIDPNVDEAREHLLQSLLVAGAIEHYAFVSGGEPIPSSSPGSNLTGDPYFTDGLRFVVFLSGDRNTPAEEAEFIEWNNSADPLQYDEQAATDDG